MYKRPGWPGYLDLSFCDWDLGDQDENFPMWTLQPGGPEQNFFDKMASLSEHSGQNAGVHKATTAMNDTSFYSTILVLLLGFGLMKWPWVASGPSRQNPSQFSLASSDSEYVYFPWRGILVHRNITTSIKLLFSICKPVGQRNCEGNWKVSYPKIEPRPLDSKFDYFNKFTREIDIKLSVLLYIYSV